MGSHCVRIWLKVSPFVVLNDLRKVVLIENATSVDISSHCESEISFSPCFHHEANLDVFCSNAWIWWFIFAQIIFYNLNCLPTPERLDIGISCCLTELSSTSHPRSIIITNLLTIQRGKDSLANLNMAALDPHTSGMETRNLNVRLCRFWSIFCVILRNSKCDSPATELGWTVFVGHCQATYGSSLPKHIYMLL